MPWLREFHVPVDDGDNGTKKIPWDFMSGYWTSREELYHRDLWFENERMKTGPVKEEYNKVAASLDEILRKHGYQRESRMYRAVPGSDETIVLFCHFGIICVMLSHLLGIPAPLLWQFFFWHLPRPPHWKQKRGWRVKPISGVKELEIRLIYT